MECPPPQRIIGPVRDAGLPPDPARVVDRFGLGAGQLVDLAGVCWLAHDGQWFLKAAEELGLETAMRLNERAIASIARIEVRELKRAAGLRSLDAMPQVADWYRLIRSLFGGSRLPEFEARVVDDDTLVVENRPCLGQPIAERSGYGHLLPGGYPPCRGWLERQRAWGEVLSERYRFTVAREPSTEQPCRYVVRRCPREGPA